MESGILKKELEVKRNMKKTFKIKTSWWPMFGTFFRNEVKTQFYTVPEALTMHRENQMPSIYNNPKAPIRLRMEFNMTTEKQASQLINRSLFF